MHWETRPDLRRRLQWFLLLRLGPTSCLLTVTGFLYYRDETLYNQYVKFLPLALGCTYFVSLLSGLFLARVRNLTLFSYAQAVFDTLFVSGAVLLTGGLQSPFPFLYHLVILNAAFLLFQRGACVAATLATLGYVGLNYIDTSLFTSLSTERFTIHLATHIVSFYAIAFLGSYITRTLFRTETLLAERDYDLGRIKALYRGVIHNLESGVIVTDADGVIEYANDPMGIILDTNPFSLIQQRVEDVFPLLETSGLPSTPFEFSLKRPDPPQKELTLRLKNSTLLDTYDNRIGLLYSIQDITSVKELERNLQETIQDAQVTERLGPRELDSPSSVATGPIGESDTMKPVHQLVNKVSQSASTVLITGDSGTGKEVVARAIHDLGPRGDRPFVPINCGGIPETLIESELFGAVKGAFTGAVRDRPGLFRQADSGTLFLDEVGELPLASQVKLLRALQERELTPVGGNRSISVDVRVIAATNRNLEEAVACGDFREDLFYRLNVLSIPLPSLREHGNDLPLLFHHFVEQSAGRNGEDSHRISP